MSEKKKIDRPDRMTRISRRLIHSGAIVDVYEDIMQAPDQKTERWDYISHRKGAAAVLPVLPDGRLLMVRQYRNAIEKETIELPAGSKDTPEEDSLVCAARELEEETGYRSGNLKLLIRLSTTPAFCNETIDIFLARDLIKSEQHLDEHEYINVEAIPPDTLIDMILRQEIQDGRTIAAVMAYNALLQKETNKIKHEK